MNRIKHMQAVARRNLLWLPATTEGILDPRTGRVRCRGACESAGLWGIAEQTVRHGTVEAQKLREEFHAGMPANRP